MRIQEIEAEITQLQREEVRVLMTWIEAYHSQLWDQQIGEDLDVGRLDTLLNEVEAEYQAGLAQPL
jgi:hypothetical protein